MIAASYEDGNDTTSLRVDPAFKIALERLPSECDLLFALDHLPAKRPDGIEIHAVLRRLTRAIRATSPRVEILVRVIHAPDRLIGRLAVGRLSRLAT